MTLRRPYAAQRTASIIDFISDPSLLRACFEGPSWDRWRAVLRGAFALPMSKQDRRLFAEVAGDRAPPKRRVRELVCAVGRGGGKDSIASALAAFVATTADVSRLRPGERASVMVLATDREQARIAFRYVRSLLEDTPLLRPLIERIEADRVLLRNSLRLASGQTAARVAGRSAAPSTTRLRTGWAKTSPIPTPRWTTPSLQA